MFLRAGQMAELDKLRTEMMNKAAITIQRCMRGHLARAYFGQRKAAVIAMQVCSPPGGSALWEPYRSLRMACSQHTSAVGYLSTEMPTEGRPLSDQRGGMCRRGREACWPASASGPCASCRRPCGCRQPGACIPSEPSSSAPARPFSAYSPPGGVTWREPWPWTSGEPLVVFVRGGTPPSRAPFISQILVAAVSVGV